MKKILWLPLFLLLSAVNAQAQSTTVSGTVTDSGAQTWNNGTFQFQFVPNPNFPTGPYTWTGGTLNKVISGSLNGSGAYSQSVPSNSAISPQGSKWILQVTPNATSPSFSTPATTITGGTQTVNVTPPAIAISWQLPPGPAISAYADGEITGNLPKGAEYFNVTTGFTRVWNGTTWANQGGGGGTLSACGGAANTQIAFFTAPTTLCSDAHFLIDPSGGGTFIASAQTANLETRGDGTGAVFLGAGATNLNFLNIDSNGAAFSITASGDPNVGTVSVAAPFFSHTSNKNNGNPAGIITYKSGVQLEFQPADPATNVANFASPVVAWATNIWNGGSTSAGGYYSQAVPGSGTNPDIKFTLFRESTFFANAGNGESILSLGKNTTSGARLELLGATSGTAIIKPPAAAGTPTLTLPTATGTLSDTIASGTSALGTSLIASGACATVVTTSATGTLTTDTFMANFNSDPTGVVGYQPSATGMLTIIKYPTADNVNFKVCNNTASSITPGAITLNWRVVR